MTTSTTRTGRRSIVLGCLASVIVAGGVWLWIGARLERFVNVVTPVALPEVTRRARDLHASARVVDLHADSLLFDRDLLRRSDVGHVDVPRLVSGGVALQVFTLPTVVPFGANIDRTEREAPDLITGAALLRWSPVLWKSPLGRALWTARRFDETMVRSGGGLVPIRSVADLDTLFALRTSGSAAVGGLLGIEGAHTTNGDPRNVAALDRAGYRMIGLTHFFDNGFAGSAHGTGKGGLTELGRSLVRDLERRRILVDLAHASAATIRDVLAIAIRPVVVSTAASRVLATTRAISPTNRCWPSRPPAV